MDSSRKVNVSEMWSSKMPQGMELEVTHHPLTMRQVVNLIIATDRLKGSRSESVLSTEFRDENLVNIMLESIIEERVVFELELTPDQFTESRVDHCSVSDTENRSLVLVQSSMELHAVLLQGGSDCHKVHLNMSTYRDLTPNPQAQTVALGIKGTKLYLSCHKVGDKPTLHLEAVDDKASLSSISSNSDMVRFLFYKQETAQNITTLVSVLFSDWYISTAAENNRPVQLCLEDAPRHRTFSIDHQVSVEEVCSS